jgi:hypothetical protein
VVATAAAPVTTRRGLTLVPDADATPGPGLPPIPLEQPARALDGALADIGKRYGERTAAFVALQLEYPWR